MKPIRFYLLAVIIVISDQLSKWAIVRSLPLQGERPLFGTFLQIHYTQNTGGAFSLFQASNAVFVAVAVIASAVLIYAYQRMQQKDLLVTTALALALGGAIGNLIDRIRFGYVIDFFDLPMKLPIVNRQWPIFNVADSAITVGIVLLAWHFLFSKTTSDERPTTDHAEPAPEPQGNHETV